MACVFGRRATCAALGLALALAWAGSARAGQTLSRFFDPATMITPDELKPGMRGTCKTVLRGVRPQEFGVEILGVLPREYRGRDMILFRVTDGPIVERESGIVQGMSGSPVYVDGRLVGAVSMAYGYSREPVGLITPINDMLHAWESEPQESAQARGPVRVPLPEPVVIGGRTVREVVLAQSLAEVGGERKRGLFLPAGLLWQVSGLCQPAIEAFNEYVKPFDMMAVLGGGIGPAIDVPMEPGSALGIQIISGDLSIVGVGTLTYTLGKRFVAFGHPMMNSGHTNFPVCSALTHTFVTSLAMSHKISSPLKTVGTMTEDRAAAVAGVLGQQAETMPMEMVVENSSQSKSRTLRLNICRNRVYTWMAIGLAVLSVISDSAPQGVESTARISLEIESSAGKFVRKNMVYHPERLSAMILREVLEPVLLLTQSEFEHAEIKSIRVRCQLIEKKTVAYIEDLVLPDYFVAPGQEVRGSVILRLEDGTRVAEPFSITVPEDTPTGPLALGVSAGMEAMMMESQMDALRPVPRSLRDLLKLYGSVPAENELVIMLSSPFSGAATAGTELPNLPKMILAVLGSAGTTDMMQGQTVVRKTKVQDRVLSGSASHPIIVVRPEDRTSEAFRERRGAAPQGARSEIRYERDLGAQTDRYLHFPWRAYLELGSNARRALATLADPAILGPFDVPRPVAQRRAWPAFRPQPLPANADFSEGEIRVERAPEKREASEEEPTVEEAEAEGEVSVVAVRKPKVWSQGTSADFLLGEPSGLAITDQGELVLASPLERIAVDAGCLYMWDIAVGPGGEAYVGTGNKGQVLRVSPQGKCSVFFRADDPEVFSVTVLPDGRVVAGTGPRGLVYLIAPEGKGRLLARTGENYVWDLCVMGDTIYAGTGPNGKLLAISFRGEVRTVYDSSAGHIAAVVPGPSGRLYLGTADKGMVVCVSPDGFAKTLCESPLGAVHALAVRRDGSVLFGGGDFDKAALFKLTTRGDVRQLLQSSDGGLLAMASSADDVAFAGTSAWARVFAVRSGESVSLLGESSEPEGQFLGLAVDDKRKVLWACTCNPAALYRAPLDEARRGEFVSQVLDAGRTADWTGISWTASGKRGAVMVYTRSGNTAAPDDTWSEWSICLDNDGRLQRVYSPPARYFQYRVVMVAEPGDPPPKFCAMRLHYLPHNGAPQVKFDEDMERWARGEYEVQFSAEDPDEDTLVYDLYYSADGGETWVEIEKDVRDSPYTWDTTTVDDGLYIIKVVASDRRANPKQPLQDEAISQPITVDNTPPRVRLGRGAVVVDERGAVHVKGYARDSTSPISTAQYRVDGGEWTPFGAADRAFDSLREELEFVVPGLEAGEHEIEVAVFDAAGNQATAKVTATVPEEKNNPINPADKKF